MTSREYAELVCLHKHEAIGYDRSDMQAAIVARAMAGGSLADFMPPRMKTESPEQTFEDMLAAMSLIPNGNSQPPVDHD